MSESLFGLRTTPFSWRTSPSWGVGGRPAFMEEDGDWSGDGSMGVCSTPEGRMVFARLRVCSVDDGSGGRGTESIYAMSGPGEAWRMFRRRGSVDLTSGTCRWLARVVDENGFVSCDMKAFARGMDRVFGTSIAMGDPLWERMFGFAMAEESAMEEASLSFAPAGASNGRGVASL